MSVNIKDGEIKLEPESDEDHDIELETENNEDQDINLEPDCIEDQDIKLESEEINLEPECIEDHDNKLESESNEDQDINLEPECNEDQDIKLESESNEDKDINLEPEFNEDQDINLESESNENQDINLEMETNEGQDIKLKPESNEDQDINLETETNEGQDIKLEKECQEKLKRINEGKQKKTFKDKSRFPAPEDKDTILIDQSQMYDFSIVKQVTGWTDKEKSMFLKVLLKMSKEKKKMEFNSKIAAVRCENKGKKISSTNKKKISTLKRQIDMVNEMELKDVAQPLDEEYDWDCVENKMSNRHDALEYKAFWKLYLHPNINKTPWSTSEHTLLLKIAFYENLQNWKKIASLLGTRRTSFQCFVYFFTHVHHPLPDKKGTKEEEEYLKRIVEYYKTGDYIPWGDMAAAMDNRQVYNKHFRLMKFRKCRFFKEEDEVILICNDKFGANFKKMAKFLPGRSSAQCKKRLQILTKKGVSTVWSTAEDQKLMKFLSHKTSSLDYSGIAQHFPDKDRQHIRSRCITLRKWMRLNPKVDIANAPRRGSRNLGHRVISRDLHSALKRLKTRIQSEVNEKKFQNMNTNSPESDVDDYIKVILSQEEDGEIEEATCIDLILSDGSDEDQHPLQFNKLDVQNFKTSLTLLRSRLDKNKFLENPLAEKCKGLLESDQDLLPVIKVKSYSRKKPETIINVGSAPDIWGTKCLPTPTYVFPPNYSTIIALRTMLSSIYTQSEKKEDATDIHTNFQNTPRFNTEEHDLLKERFNTLLLWPMLLANQPPQGIEPPPYVKKKLPKKPPHFDKGDWNTVAIPKPKAKDKVHNIIDLKESASISKINIDLQSVIETSNFDRIKF